ncbi:hypothetical protein AB4332_12735 [Vibrio breoganii]
MTPREEMIERDLAEYKRSNNQATYAIELRGKKEYLPVIRVNPSDLLLNPKNNRLSGQLKDHPKRTNIEADPVSVDSQELLHELLAKTAKYKELKNQLQDLGQHEPGLITREGLLVNGNTRVAALRELKKNHVEVAVLPPNINDTDVLSMEMDLQLTDLVHQDYTFTNELLFMQRFLDADNSKEELATKKAWVRQGVKKVNDHMRLLSYIEEVRVLANIPYSVFDSKQQHLKDLDKDYMSLKRKGDIDAAESLKWSRLKMTFMGLNKDQVRAIDADFIEKDLLPRLNDEDSKDLRSHITEYRTVAADDGLDDLLGEQKTPSIDMKKALEDFLNDTSIRDFEGDITKDLNGLYGKLAFNARRATEAIIDDQKLTNANAAPGETLKEARVKIQMLRLKLPSMMRDPSFKKDKFAYNLKELMAELEKLQLVINDEDDE